VARARGEQHRFDGEAEKVEVDERAARVDDPSRVTPPAPADNAQQAARAARARAARRRSPR
jgi:hypothetical protein